MARGLVTVYNPKDASEAKPPQPAPKPSPVDLTKLTVEDLIGRGRRLIEENRLDDAVRALEWAHEFRPGDARTASYFGLALALSGRDARRGADLCRDAIKREFYRAELYRNHGRVLLVLRDRRKAIATFKKGLKVEPSNEDLKRELESLGKRRAPVFSFLGRSHFLNKMMGKLRSQFSQGSAGS